MNGGGVADGSEYAVFTSNQLSYEFQTYTSGCTNDTPSLLSGFAIQNLGYLIHVSKKGSGIGPNEKGASDWDTSTAGANMGVLLKEPAARPEEALSRARLKPKRKWIIDQRSSRIRSRSPSRVALTPVSSLQAS